MHCNSEIIQALKQDKVVKYRPHGNSLSPLVTSDQLVTVEPIRGRSIIVDNIVVCLVNGRNWLHKIVAISDDGRFLIGNNHGRVDGWCTLDNIYGVMTAVEA
jgi:hypothetical protein